MESKNKIEKNNENNEINNSENKDSLMPNNNNKIKSSEIIERIDKKLDFEFILKGVEIKNRIGIYEKVVLLKKVKYDFIEEENGVYVYDNLLGSYRLDVTIIAYYTNIEFEDNMPAFDELDIMKHSGLFDFIISHLKYDYDILKTNYNKNIETILASRNNAEMVFVREVTKISAHVLNLINNANENIVGNIDARKVNGFINTANKFLKNQMPTK